MFDRLVANIERQYRRQNFSLGWRFLTCSKKNLSPQTDVVFLTLNPGGDVIPPDHPSASCESGSAYVVESWGNSTPGASNLQVQIRSMFQILQIDINNVLSGQLVPFRSPSWIELPNCAECVTFGKKIWSEIIEYVQPKLIIAMGKTQLRPVLLDILGEPVHCENVLVNWGKITAGIDVYEGKRVISLPHLSRFGIMTRPESRSAVDYLFERKKE